MSPNEAKELMAEINARMHAILANQPGGIVEKLGTAPAVMMRTTNMSHRRIASAIAMEVGGRVQSASDKPVGAALFVIPVAPIVTMIDRAASEISDWIAMASGRFVPLIPRGHFEWRTRGGERFEVLVIWVGWGERR